MKSIDVLPDDILLGIFDVYMKGCRIRSAKRRVEAWQLLVHVCRRWRSLIFQSPGHLNLQLFCTPDTPTKDTLDIWPALPLIVRGEVALSSGTDNVIAALAQSNRVREVNLTVLGNWQLDEVLTAMEVPLPELTDLRLKSESMEYDETIIPDSFLGRSAPRLRVFTLDYVPFPGFPNLLLSANHLVELRLVNIPHSGYISPPAIVALISVLSSLRILCLQFQSPRSLHDLESPSLPPPKRSILPALDEFRFQGATEYLEEVVTSIDTPQLDKMHITFFDHINFDCPRLAQFIGCTPALLGAPGKARVKFKGWTSSVALLARPRTLEIVITYGEPDRQLWSVGRICNYSLPPPLTVDDLYIGRRLGYSYSQPVWRNDGTLWLQLLLPFTAVKRLYLSREFAPGIAVALQELGGNRPDGITVLLPNLQNIFVEGLEPSGPFQEYIVQFVAARQLSGHAIVISVWDDVSDRDLVSDGDSVSDGGSVSDEDSVSDGDLVSDGDSVSEGGPMH